VAEFFCQYAAHGIELLTDFKLLSIVTLNYVIFLNYYLCRRVHIVSDVFVWVCVSYVRCDEINDYWCFFLDMIIDIFFLKGWLLIDTCIIILWADCIPLCIYRCKFNLKKMTCITACMTCCDRCKCVPLDQTYGNREKCGKCYTDMLTHHDKVKCP